MQNGQPDIEVGQIREEEHEPWRYLGYPSLVSFIASDPELMIVRRFDELHTRALLSTQDQLSEIEERLNALNIKFIKEGGTDNGTFRKDRKERRQLDKELVRTLLKYDKLLLRYHAVSSLPKPLKWKPECLQTWLKNNGCFHESSNKQKKPGMGKVSNSSTGKVDDSTTKDRGAFTINHSEETTEDSGGAIEDKEASFVMHVEDLVAIRQPPKVAVRAYFDHLVLKYCDSLFRFFRKDSKEKMAHWRGGRLLVSNEERVNRFVVVSEFLAALVLFIAPLWILQAVSSTNAKLVVITVFVLACLILLSFAMSGSPFQILAATAGYSAVLVVFVQPISKS